MNKKGKNRKGILYSTDPNFQYKYKNEELETPPNNQQDLKICIDKHRAGKVAVIIKGFVGTTDNLKELSKILKTRCGVGGSVKKGEIIIQGNIREKVMDILKEKGYNFKRVGG